MLNRDKIDILVEQYLAWDELADTEKEMADTLEEINTGSIKQLTRIQAKGVIKDLVQKKISTRLAMREEIKKALKEIIKDSKLKGHSTEWINARAILRKKEILKKYAPEFKKIKDRILNLRSGL